MKNKILIFTAACCLLSTAHLFAQAPDIDWSKKLVADNYDLGRAAFPTPDGGYLLAATSDSPISGSKTIASLGGFDIWLIKLNASRVVVWQKVIGGAGYDGVQQMKQTSDGNFIIGAVSSSGVSAMKSQPSRGGNDYWLVKIDVDGNILWERTFGGSSSDNLRAVNETPDGGFIMNGYSISDSSGEKSEDNFPGGSFGSNDYWVVKADATGNMLWENTLGGDDGDFAYAAIGTPDGGAIVGGSSYSNTSYDKSEDSFNDYTDDFWIIRLDHLGAVIWDQTIGGLSGDECHDILHLSDGNYLLGGRANSDISGDKTENSRGLGDYWVVKINDDGDILWQKTMGGDQYDGLLSMDECADGSIVACGYSSSAISGEKTEAGLGFDDYWVVKFNFDGEMLWDKSIGFSGDDEANTIIQTADGGYLVSGETGNDHQQAYFVKLEADGCFPSTEICNGLDDDCDGLTDEGLTETISISAGGATTFCQGGSVLLTATYSGTTVQWKKNGVNIAGATSSTYSATKSGNYTCETSSACDTELSNSIAVTVNKNPAASISAGGATTFCAGGSVTLTETPVGGSTYQWYKGANPIAGQTTTSYIATTAGNYKCRVTKTATGCYKNSNAITVTVPCKEGEANTNNPITNNEITIFPNPSAGTFTITINTLASANSPIGGQRGLFIYNSLGQLIYSKQLNSPDGNVNETISLDHLSSGIYFVQLHNDQFYSEQKLIIE